MIKGEIARMSVSFFLLFPLSAFYQERPSNSVTFGAQLAKEVGDVSALFVLSCYLHHPLSLNLSNASPCVLLTKPILPLTPTCRVERAIGDILYSLCDPQIRTHNPSQPHINNNCLLSLAKGSTFSSPNLTQTAPDTPKSPPATPPAPRH